LHLNSLPSPEGGGSIGEAARKDISEIADAKVHLFLFVKVREDWAEKSEHYKEIGLDFPSE
jgi:GTP-binding protein Era